MPTRDAAWWREYRASKAGRVAGVEEPVAQPVAGLSSEGLVQISSTEYNELMSRPKPIAGISIHTACDAENLKLMERLMVKEQALQESLRHIRLQAGRIAELEALAGEVRTAPERFDDIRPVVAPPIVDELDAVFG